MHRALILTLLIFAAPMTVLISSIDYSQEETIGESLDDIPDSEVSAKSATNPLGWEWVAKDYNGGFFWTRTVDADSSGDSYIAGVYRGGSVSIGSHHANNNGGLDVFVAKIDPNGLCYWLVTFGGALDEHVEDLVVDNAGSLYVVGSYDSPQFNASTSILNNSGSRDGYALQIATGNGSIGWGLGLNGAGFDNITGVTVDSTGSLVFSGWTTSPQLTVNNSVLNNSGDSDFVVLWANNSGNWDQGRIYGGSGKEQAHDIAADGNGKVMVVAEFTSSSLTLDQTSISHGGGSGSDSLVMRVSTNGVEWVRKPICSMNDRAWRVAVDTAGNVFVVGEIFTNNSNSHAITWGSIQLNGHRAYQTVYVVKFSNVGAIGWALETRSSYNYKYVNNPSIDVLGSRLILGMHANYEFRFYSGTSYSNNVYLDNNGQWNGIVVELTNTGSKTGSHGSNSRQVATNIDDVAWVDMPSGSEHVMMPFNAFSSSSTSYRSSNNAPATDLYRYAWSNGPSSYQFQVYIGYTGSEQVLDLEPYGNNSTIMLIYADQYSMNHRFGNHSLGGKYSHRLLLVVSDENGTWTHLDQIVLGNIDTSDGIAGMAVSPNGTVWVTFYWSSSIDMPGLLYRSSGSGIAVASWTPSGSWQSLDNIGFSTSYYVRYDIAVDANGDVWVSGACAGTVYMHGQSYSGQNNWNICIAKRDATNGWNSIYRSNNYDSPRLDAITEHPSGGIVMWVRSGNYQNPSGSSTSVYYYPGALIRLFSNNGTMWWQGQPSCNSGNCNLVQSLDVKPNGDVIIAGYFQNSMSFPNCCSVNSGGGYDGYVAQFNASGNWDWSIALGGTSDDYVYDVSYIGNGSIAVVGSKNGVISVGLTTLSSAGTGFVAMASDTGTWEWAAQPTGSTTIQSVTGTGNGTIEVAGQLLYSNSPRTFGLDSLRSSDGEDIFISRMSSDTDADGITDNRDNCQQIYNPSQTNYDSDNAGDICDSDDDDEGILDSQDSCQLGALGWLSNNTTDHDSDGCKDDIEDSDDDNDGLVDGSDSCRIGDLNWTSTGLTDYDGDGCRDSSEDDDDDDDTVNDTADRCPKGALGWISNALTDHDGDGCLDSSEDSDDDDDGIGDEYDTCIYGETNWTSSNVTDNDGDGCLDATEDLNDDNDHFPDYDDSCPNGTVGWYSGSITDYDGDGCKDSDEDTDDDADGVLDVDDNCPRGIQGWVTNPTVDFDGDGCHDWNEDSDDDGDGISDIVDKCAMTPAGEAPDADGCASGQVPSSGGGGGGSVNYTLNNTYVNNTYVNNTYVNNSYENNSFDNETYQNQTYQNNSYSNETFQNQSFSNTTHLNQTINEGDNSTTDDQSQTETGGEYDSGISWLPLAVVAILVALLMIQALQLMKKPVMPSGPPEEMLTAQEFFDDEDHTMEVAREEYLIDSDDSYEDLDEIQPQDVEETQQTESENPPLVVENPIISDGFEWIEWPPSSGQNHFRGEGTQDDWQKWPLE